MAAIRTNPLAEAPPSGTASNLDPLQIDARIQALKLLKPGWLDGQGVPPEREALDWLAAAFRGHYPHELPPPYLFPTPEGQVLVEWSVKPWSPSLGIDLAKKRGEWHVLNLDTDEEAAKSLDLTKPDDWQWLAGQLRQMRGDKE